MAIKTTVIDGKTVKLYPAFNTEAHAHDIEYRRNRLSNEIYATLFPDWDTEGRYTPIKDLDKAEQLEQDLTEILGWLDWPVTYLPYNLYSIARETITWAGCARGAARRR